MTKAMYSTLKDGIENVIQFAKPLPRDPSGQHYYRGSRYWNQYLVELGVLGPAGRIYTPDRQRYSAVDLKRAEEVRERLTELEREVGEDRVKRLRVDLEQLGVRRYRAPQ